MICGRLDKIEAIVQETKTLSSQAYNGLHELENRVWGIREVLENL
jgi:hypothetical protein